MTTTWRKRIETISEKSMCLFVNYCKDYGEEEEEDNLWSLDYEMCEKSSKPACAPRLALRQSTLVNFASTCQV